MCLICLEFNKSRDFIDAKLMIEAARREADTIPESHLKKIETELSEMDQTNPKFLKIP